MSELVTWLMKLVAPHSFFLVLLLLPCKATQLKPICTLDEASFERLGMTH